MSLSPSVFFLKLQFSLILNAPRTFMLIISLELMLILCLLADNFPSPLLSCILLYVKVFLNFRTNLLICQHPKGYNYFLAKKKRIPCLTPAWVLDSVNQGYAQQQVCPPDAESPKH
jgi:BRCA1 C Terminus (BRCT) domain